MKLILISVSVLLNYLAPIFVAILSPTFFKEKIKITTIVSLPLSLLGVALIFNEQVYEGSTIILGIVYGLLSRVCYAIFILVSKKIWREYSSSLTSQTIYVKEEVIPLLLLIGSINTAFAVTIYFHGLGFIEVWKAVILTYLDPLSAAFLGVLFLNQTPFIPLIVEGILIN